MIDLVYTGDRFYSDSGTRMSSLYIHKYLRYDWGKVRSALDGGESVTIRPATPDELVYFERELQRLKDENP